VVVVLAAPICWTTDVGRAAKPTPTGAARGETVRAGGGFFARPSGPNHRRYEALRAYLYEGLSVEAAAARAGYSVATLRSAVRDFRAGKTGFFANPRPGPTRSRSTAGQGSRGRGPVCPSEARKQRGNARCFDSAADFGS
jgi:Helix-turn-helix domain